MFGWTEGDNSTEQGNPLILYTGGCASSSTCCRPRRFLRAPRLDHFGLEVASVEELTDIVDRARAYQANDDRVTIIDDRRW